MLPQQLRRRRAIGSGAIAGHLEMIWDRTDGKRLSSLPLRLTTAFNDRTVPVQAACSPLPRERGSGEGG